MSKGFWAIVAVIVAVFAGILFFKGGNETNAPGTGGQVSNHVKGQGAKGVTLQEYGDYQCPVCGAYFPVVKQVLAKYGDDLKFQFSNLPLTQVHQNAFAAARAAEAADLQGKFWEMNSMLYQNQLAWSQSSTPQTIFNQYATQLGLNLTKFKADFASAKVNAVINADAQAFRKRSKEIATPTFYLNGTHIKPPLSYGPDNQTVDVEKSAETFAKFIDDEIAKQAGEQDKNTPATQQPTE